MTETIGDRVKESIPLHLSQRALAPEIGMTHDALSRAIRNQRNFSALELARLAALLSVDTHWLITGESDPFKVRLAARHLWGQTADERADQDASDTAIIRRVVSAYRAAYEPTGLPAEGTTPLPVDPRELRALLPDPDIRTLAVQVEDVLGIDIIRDPGLTTDYSFRIGDHAVVLLKSTAHWFRANWSIAHELGHLALGHHVNERTTEAEERPADAFASEFLLPEEVMGKVDWRAMTAPALSVWLWDQGVSTAALFMRLRELRLTPSAEVREALTLTTPKLLRAHLDAIIEATQGTVDNAGAGTLTRPSAHGPWASRRFDIIVERENVTTGRQFPDHLVWALTERVEAGEADPYLLAWVRDVPVDDLSWPEPDTDSPLTEPQETVRATGDWFELLQTR